MIQNETILKVSDNSGINLVKCIKLLKGSKRKSCKVGDFIVVSVKNVDDKSKLKKKIYLALIVGTRKLLKRKNGSYISFKNNKVILFEEKNKIFGNRIFGPIPIELKKAIYSTMNSLVKIYI